MGPGCTTMGRAPMSWARARVASNWARCPSRRVWSWDAGATPRWMKWMDRSTPLAAASTLSRRVSAGVTASGQWVQEPNSSPLKPCSTANSMPRSAVHSGPSE